MADLPKEGETWRTGYNFALLLLFVVGVLLIIIGTIAFDNGDMWNVILVNTGVSMAPAAIVAELFRVFLFKEVKYELTNPVLDEVRDRLGPEIKEQVDEMMTDYRDEIVALKALRQAGVNRPYRHRDIALHEFASAIDAEINEIMIVGSSLKGLIQKEDYQEISSKLQFKLRSGNVAVKFLLTHPVVADLRARQEARRSTDIGKEIIESLKKLKEWGVPPDCVRLYKGTPTCFAIKTRSEMLLNPYPYGDVAYDSPCLIVKTSHEDHGYFYNAFDRSHFGAWDTRLAARIEDYDKSIAELEEKLDVYAKKVSELFEL